MHRVVIRRTLVALACGLLLHGQIGKGRSDTEAPRVVLGPGAKDLIVGPGMNATGRDLRGCEFVGQDLTGARFDGCNLYRVRFEDCILNRAFFRRASFVGATISVGPNFEGADFTDATINGAPRFGRPGNIGFGYYGFDISPSQLMSTWSYKNKDLYRCRIRGSRASEEPVAFSFRDADLREATLWEDLSKCDFTNARIDKTTFMSDSFTFDQLASTWDFKQRRLRVRLYSAGRAGAVSPGKWDLSHINLVGSELWLKASDADFTDATVNDCTIGIGLTTAQLYSTRSYQRGDLTGLQLVSSDQSGCDLSGMNLTGCSFSHCNFSGANFTDAVITGTRFSIDSSSKVADQLTLQQIKSTWNYKHGHMEGIRLPDNLAAALKAERAATKEKTQDAQ